MIKVRKRQGILCPGKGEYLISSKEEFYKVPWIEKILDEGRDTIEISPDPDPYGYDTILRVHPNKKSYFVIGFIDGEYRNILDLPKFKHPN